MTGAPGPDASVLATAAAAIHCATSAEENVQAGCARTP
jgi:hypothetical protein